MKNVTFTIKGISPYSQSKHIMEPRKERETAEDWEKRTWRERLHYDDKGQVYIPPMSIKSSIAECAKFLSIQIPGKGKSTYTKHFDAGLLCAEPVFLDVKKDDVPGEWLFLNADGVRGSGKRVMKCYPRIENWEGTVHMTILDDTITQDVFEHHLKRAGQFIGIGRFRPRNGGYYGRFTYDNLQVMDEAA